MKSSITEFKSLKPVILFIKKLLSNNNLLDTYTGGLNSYSVVIMAVCVANEMVSVNSPPNSAEYLKQFLLYYKSYETFRSYAITKNGRVERSLDDPSVFYIQDPNNPANNTSKACFQTDKIISIFEQTYNKLEYLLSAPFLQDNPLDYLLQRHD